MASRSPFRAFKAGIELGSSVFFQASRARGLRLFQVFCGLVSCGFEVQGFCV